MNLQELMSDLDEFYEREGADSRDDHPVLVELPDGTRLDVTGVNAEESCLVLAVDLADDWAEGSYGGAEDAPRTRQDALRGSIADKAGLSALHR